MILLNFSHPLTSDQLTQVTTLLGEEPIVHPIAVQIDRKRPLQQVATALANTVDLSPQEWQTTPLLINPPGLAPLALALIAEIHGRAGYFVPILNIRPVEGATPPRFEVAEIVNLQTLRDSARQSRA